MTTRAKFRCISVTTNEYTTRRYEFSAIYDNAIPEDQRFALSTPMASASLSVDNPDVTFEPGQSYYFDISPVPAL